jgi:hypothetical protein
MSAKPESTTNEAEKTMISEKARRLLAAHDREVNEILAKSEKRKPLIPSALKSAG